MSFVDNPVLPKDVCHISKSKFAFTEPRVLLSKKIIMSNFPPSYIPLDEGESSLLPSSSVSAFDTGLYKVDPNCETQLVLYNHDAEHREDVETGGYMPEAGETITTTGHNTSNMTRPGDGFQKSQLSLARSTKCEEDASVFNTVVKGYVSGVQSELQAQITSLKSVKEETKISTETVAKNLNCLVNRFNRVESHISHLDAAGFRNYKYESQLKFLQAARKTHSDDLEGIKIVMREHHDRIKKTEDDRASLVDTQVDFKHRLKNLEHDDDQKVNRLKDFERQLDVLEHDVQRLKKSAKNSRIDLEIEYHKERISELEAHSSKKQKNRH